MAGIWGVLLHGFIFLFAKEGQQKHIGLFHQNVLLSNVDTKCQARQEEF